jgi:hypothetical protein
MIDVTEDWWIAIALAAGCGAVGGLVYDLLLTRFGDSGLLELFSAPRPSDSGNRRYVDLGFLASVLVGLVAAVGFLYFLTPEVTTAVSADGTAETTREYDPFKLIAASLIVGTSGAAFIKSMQERLLKVVATTSLQNLQNAIDQEKSQIDALKDKVDDTSDPLNADAALDQLSARMGSLQATASGLVRPVL